jgi:hypothetical protein
MPVINPEINKLRIESKIFLLNEIASNRINNLINKLIKTAYTHTDIISAKNPPFVNGDLK